MAIVMFSLSVTIFIIFTVEYVNQDKFISVKFGYFERKRDVFSWSGKIRVNTFLPHSWKKTWWYPDILGTASNLILEKFGEFSRTYCATRCNMFHATCCNMLHAEYCNMLHATWPRYVSQLCTSESITVRISTFFGAICFVGERLRTCYCGYLWRHHRQVQYTCPVISTSITFES